MPDHDRRLWRRGHRLREAETRRTDSTPTSPKSPKLHAVLRSPSMALAGDISTLPNAPADAAITNGSRRPPTDRLRSRSPRRRCRRAPRTRPAACRRCATSMPSDRHVPAPGLSVMVYVSVSGFAPLATIRLGDWFFLEPQQAADADAEIVVNGHRRGLRPTSTPDAGTATSTRPRLKRSSAARAHGSALLAERRGLVRERLPRLRNRGDRDPRAGASRRASASSASRPTPPGRCGRCRRGAIPGSLMSAKNAFIA